jgi:hypothetical protein
MATHIKVLGIIHIAFGAFGLALAFLVLLLFGGIAGLVGVSGEEGAFVAAPVVGIIGTLLFLVMALLSLPGIVAGIGLLGFRPWARILAIIVSAVHLLNIPLGTLLGVYGLWALLNSEGEALFGPGGPARGA